MVMSVLQVSDRSYCPQSTGSASVQVHEEEEPNHSEEIQDGRLPVCFRLGFPLRPGA